MIDHHSIMHNITLVCYAFPGRSCLTMFRCSNNLGFKISIKIIICFLRTINASSNITPIRKSFPHNKLFTYISHGVLSIFDIRSTPKNNKVPLYDHPCIALLEFVRQFPRIIYLRVTSIGFNVKQSSMVAVILDFRLT